jgi:hypothetical protein
VAVRIDHEQPRGDRGADADEVAKLNRDGDVIPASRVTTNVELQQVLATLFPLLRSIRPADLNTTLYALSTALATTRRPASCARATTRATPSGIMISSQCARVRYRREARRAPRRSRLHF